MRMKRPLINMDVQMETITGTHVTPLTQNLFSDPPPILDVLNPLGPPIRKLAKDQFLQTIKVREGPEAEGLGSWRSRGSSVWGRRGGRTP